MSRRKRKLVRKGRTAARKPVTLSAAPTPADRWASPPDTPAQRAGVVIEPACWTDPETGAQMNPNNVKRFRRIDMAESYHKRGKLDLRQFEAAKSLRDAWEATQRTAPAIKAIQVDSSPKPDAHVAIQIDRASELSAISKHIPAESKAVIDMVVFSNHSVAHHPAYRNRNLAKGMRLLQSGLDAVAEGLGI